MRRRTSILSSLFLIAFVACCAAILVAAAILYAIPGRAESVFGSASPDLDTFSYYYLSTMLLLNEDNLFTPADPAGMPRPFTVEFGESASSVIFRLESEGIISDGDPFRMYLQYRGMDKTIQAGNYSLNPAMPAIVIAQSLQDATPTEVEFNILAGWRLEEIAATLPTSGLNITPQAFLNRARLPADLHPLVEQLPPAASLEGFLFPDEYTFSRDVSLSEFLQTMLDRFSESLSPEIQEGFRRQGLELYQAVTLASIVEREAVIDREKTQIASVFLNRLAAGIKLESDPTVQYAIGFQSIQNTWWTNPLSADDLFLDSPYNTYAYPGLPPGPISNPGLEALRAVAFPAVTPYYFFRAKCDGTGLHLFAETFAEHLQNACP